MNNILLERLIERVKTENNGMYQAFLIPEDISKIITTYTAMKADLEYVGNVAQELIDYEHSDLITISVWTSLLITYGKCFVDATNTRSPKLESKDCFTDRESMLEKTHKELMNLRHNFVAHRGITAYEASLCFLTIGTEKFGIGVKTVKRVLPERATLIDIILLVEHLGQIVDLKYKVASAKLLQGIQNNYNAEQMQQFRII